MADSGFQEVLLDGPLHQVVIDGGPGDALVIGDGFEVISFEGRDVCSLEVQLVRESTWKTLSAAALIATLTHMQLTVLRCHSHTTLLPSRMPPKPS